MMINQINVGVIGTGWCGGIRANACADNPLVDKLYIAETNSNRLKELKNSLNIEMATENWQELVNNKNIGEISDFSVKNLQDFFKNISLKSCHSSSYLQYTQNLTKIV